MKLLSPRSILLTTLLGEQVDPLKSISDSSYYSNVPTTLRHVVEDLGAIPLVKRR